MKKFKVKREILLYHLFPRVRQLHHTLISLLLLHRAGLEAQLLRGDPHQLLGGPVGLGQRVVHCAAVPIQELVCVRHDGFRVRQSKNTEQSDLSERDSSIWSLWTRPQVSTSYTQRQKPYFLYTVFTYLSSRLLKNVNLVEVWVQVRLLV